MPLAQALHRGQFQRCGVADRLDALSHGNQQRVQLIAALVNDPDLLVLDEPFSGLDPIAMEAMGELLSGLATEGAAVLFSSRQLDLVEDLCQERRHHRAGPDRAGRRPGGAAGQGAVAVATVHSIDVPAVPGTVLAWALVWFVLGYALYATVYGALGSLGSRIEGAQSVAGPVMDVMVVAYFASFTMIGRPDSAAARAISYFPLTAPMAMPGRIAMGATTWWEPVGAVVLTLAATAGLVRLAGRVYTRAILHSGPALSLRDIWRGSAASDPGASGASPRKAKSPPQLACVTAGGRTAMAGADLTGYRRLITVLTGIGVVLVWS